MSIERMPKFTREKLVKPEGEKPADFEVEKSVNPEAKIEGQKLADNEKKFLQKLLEARPDMKRRLQRLIFCFLILTEGVMATAGFTRGKEVGNLEDQDAIEWLKSSPSESMSKEEIQAEIEKILNEAGRPGFQKIYSETLIEKIGEKADLTKKFEGIIPEEDKSFLIETIFSDSVRERDDTGYNRSVVSKRILSIPTENQKIEKIGETLTMEGAGTTLAKAILHALTNAAEFTRIKIDGSNTSFTEENKKGFSSNFSQKIKTKSEVIIKGYRFNKEEVGRDEHGNFTVSLDIDLGIIKT